MALATRIADKAGFLGSFISAMGCVRCPLTVALGAGRLVHAREQRSDGGE